MMSGEAGIVEAVTEVDLGKQAASSVAQVVQVVPGRNG